MGVLMMIDEGFLLTSLFVTQPMSLIPNHTQSHKWNGHSQCNLDEKDCLLAFSSSEMLF